MVNVFVNEKKRNGRHEIYGLAAYVHVLCDRLDNFFGGSYPTGTMYLLGKQHLNAFLHIAAVGKDKMLKSQATCCHLVRHTFIDKAFLSTSCSSELRQCWHSLSYKIFSMAD